MDLKSHLLPKLDNRVEKANNYFRIYFQNCPRVVNAFYLLPKLQFSITRGQSHAVVTLSVRFLLSGGAMADPAAAAAAKEEDEEEVCRFCFEREPETELMMPCRCKGTIAKVHRR